MLSHVVSAQQTDWDDFLLPCVYAHNNHLSRATGLAPMELHIGRYPRLPMTILGSQKSVHGMQSKKRDDLDYLQLMRERQTQAYQLAVEKDQLTKEKHRANNEALDNVLTKRVVYQPGMWVWVYDPQHTLRTAQDGARKGSAVATNRIKAKLAKLWTGPFKVLAVGPGRFGDKEIGSKLLYLDLPLASQTNPRVSVARCKRCHQPGAPEDIPAHLPWEICAYVLHRFADMAPPFYLTTDDVEIELDVARAQPVSISGHRLSRGPGGAVASTQFETHWRGHRKPTWEAEINLMQYGDFVQKYWRSKHVQQVGADNQTHRNYHQLAAHRAEARTRNSLYVPPGYALMSKREHGPELLSAEMKGAHIFLRTPGDGWQLGVVHQVSRVRDEPRPYNVNFVDMDRRFNVSLRPEHYCTDVAAAPSAWCFLVHIRSGSVRRSGS